MKNYLIILTLSIILIAVIITPTINAVDARHEDDDPRPEETDEKKLASLTILRPTQGQVLTSETIFILAKVDLPNELVLEKYIINIDHGDPITVTSNGDDLKYFATVSGDGDHFIEIFTVTNPRATSLRETVNFIVSLPDNTDPVITAPSDKTFEATPILTPLTTDQIGTATATDNRDLNPVITNNAPTTFPIGNTIIIWRATDANNNFATSEQTITIQEITPELSELDLLREQIIIQEQDIESLQAEIARLYHKLFQISILSDSITLLTITEPPTANYPTVTIFEPTNQIFSVGEIVTFSAVASDIEDGENLEIQWESDFYGSFGTGNEIHLELTQVGWDVISATVVDSDSNVMIDDITIQVIEVPNTPPQITTPLTDTSHGRNNNWIRDVSQNFEDAEDLDSELQFTATYSYLSGNPDLVQSLTFTDSTLKFSTSGDSAGAYLITVRVIDTGGLFVEDDFMVGLN